MPLLHFAFFLLAYLSTSSSLLAVDTLQVSPSDPVLEKWRWKHFNQESGLIGRVLDITEDRDGNIWFATQGQGVQRYDGVQWTTYTTADGLARDHVQTVIQTQDGAMWFGTIGGGLSRFDPAAAPGPRWKTYTEEDGLASNVVGWRSLEQTRDGTLWAGFKPKAALSDPSIRNPVGTGRSQVPAGQPGDGRGSGHPLGISRFDGHTWSPVLLPEEVLQQGRGSGNLRIEDGYDGRLGPSNPLQLGSAYVVDIHEVSDGTLWFGTRGFGVLRFDPRVDEGRWTRYTESDGLPWNSVVAILESSDGDIWVTHQNRGISRFDGETWRTHPLQEFGVRPGAGGMLSLWQTSDGTIWAGGTYALARFDASTDSWKSYTGDDLPRGLTVAGQPTRDGAVWFWDWWGKGQTYRFNPTTTKWRTFAVSANVFGGFPARDGSVWFSTPEGALQFDGRNWLQYTEADGLLDAPIHWMEQTDDGSLWFVAEGPSYQLGTEPTNRFSGLSRYRGGRWTRFTSEEVGIDRIFTQSASGQSIRSNSTSYGYGSIFHARDGAIWIVGSLEGASVASRYDGQTWRAYKPAGGFVGHTLSHFNQATNGDLWFSDRGGGGSGRPDGGIVRFDGTSWTVYTTDDGLMDNRTYSLTQTPDGTIWAGTFIGLNGFDGTNWHSYSIEEGVAATKPRSFALDGGDLWFTYQPDLAAGVTRLSDRTFTTFTILDGLVHNEVRYIYPSTDGAVWFGTAGGIGRFDGTNWSGYTARDGLPGSQVAKIWQDAGGTYWFFTEHGRTSRKVGTFTPDADAPETVLEATPDVVSSLGNILLKWSGGDPWGDTPRDALLYQWRINDGPWESSRHRRDQTFTSLSSGSHRFEVRAIDRDGNTDPTPAVHSFIVEVPWWRNPIVAGPGLILVGFALFQTVRVVQGKRKLQKSVDALSNANNELFQVNVDLQREQVLERLRGQAQGMQSSEEFGPVVEAVYRELNELGLPLITTNITMPVSETETEVWSTDANGRAAARFTRLSYEDHSGVAARERGDAYVHNRRIGEEMKQMIRGQIEAGHPRWQGVPEDHWPDCGFNYRFLLERGATLGVLSEEAVDDDILRLIGRFSEVFGFAHQRWQELKQKETQNRRLAVEASVQRLRAEVQSMDEASDFERILSLLTESLKTVELTFDGCEIDVLDKPVENPTMAHFEANGFRYTTFRLDTDGNVAPRSYNVTAPFQPVNERTIERFIAGEPWQGTSEGEAIVEVPAGAYGRLRLTASERDSFTDDEVATLREFADAVALGYARYLDIREIQLQTERKSAFLASMSHELRTPMNAIKGFTNLVLRREESLSDRGEENLHKVDRASDHLLAMINDLLDLSKIEAGRIDVSPERFNVKGLIATCCDTVSPLIQEGVELRQDVADNVGEANTDRARVQQMIINLLSNAIKFTDSGAVTVTARRQQAAGSRQKGNQAGVSPNDPDPGSRLSALGSRPYHFCIRHRQRHSCRGAPNDL